MEADLEDCPNCGSNALAVLNNSIPKLGRVGQLKKFQWGYLGQFILQENKLF
jgi:hypothetical protein